MLITVVKMLWTKCNNGVLFLRLKVMYYLIDAYCVFYLHQIPVISLWIQIQWIKTCYRLKRTGWLNTLVRNSHMLIIQTDLKVFLRCCVERECVDAVTGRWSGVVGWVYQCHIRASAGRDGERSVSLGVMISPGVCTALTPAAHSGTITNRLNFLESPAPLE